VNVLKILNGVLLMEESKKMNILVLGVSGAGKSTLIKAISGTEVVTGVGEGNTQKIDVYESSTWPLRCIDTKGFEYNIIEQYKTIHQIKKFTKEQIADKDDDNVGIDAVWYCIEGTARRTFSHNINLMNKAIKGWKNIPVFAVITKSYSEVDIPANIEAVEQAFAKSQKSINLKKIIPVVAEEYAINEEVIVPPRGIDTLCLETLDCLDEAKELNKTNRDAMILEQKRFTSHGLVIGSTTSAVVIGAVPIPFPDSVILVPLETGLTKLIFKIYGIDYSNDLITGIVGSTMLTNIAKQILKTIPIAGAVANGVVGGALVFALGESVILASEAMYSGKLDPTKIDETVKFVGEKVKENPIIDYTVSYFEKNKDKILDKKPKEIFNEILDSMKNTKRIAN